MNPDQPLSASLIRTDTMRIGFEVNAKSQAVKDSEPDGMLYTLHGVIQFSWYPHTGMQGAIPVPPEMFAMTAPGDFLEFELVG